MLLAEANEPPDFTSGVPPDDGIPLSIAELCKIALERLLQTGREAVPIDHLGVVQERSITHYRPVALGLSLVKQAISNVFVELQATHPVEIVSKMLKETAESVLALYMETGRDHVIARNAS